MKRFIALFFAAFLLLQISLTVCAAPPEEPSLDVKAAMLVDLDNDQVLYTKNEDERIYPASLTKIMTALLTIEWAEEQGALERDVTVSAGAIADLDPNGSTAWLQAGEKMPLRDLLKCILVTSANDACNVAAETVAGSIDAFVEQMNSRAAALGCTGTHFANPHGLHDENHYTTAHDLRLIVEAAIADDTFWQICTIADDTIPATNLSQARELHSSNYMVSTYYGSAYYDERVAGIKTGFTTPAGRCLIVTAAQDDHRVLSIVCGAPDTEVIAGQTLYGHFVETKKLLNYGFALLDAAGEPEEPADVITPADQTDRQPDPALPGLIETLPEEEPSDTELAPAPEPEPGTVAAHTGTLVTIVKWLVIFLVFWLILYIVLRVAAAQKRRKRRRARNRSRKPQQGD